MSQRRRVGFLILVVAAGCSGPRSNPEEAQRLAGPAPDRAHPAANEATPPSAPATPSAPAIPAAHVLFTVDNADLRADVLPLFRTQAGVIVHYEGEPRAVTLRLHQPAPWRTALELVCGFTGTRIAREAERGVELEAIPVPVLPSRFAGGGEAERPPEPGPSVHAGDASAAGRRGPAAWSGTGFFIAPQLIVTNAHVVHGAPSMTVQMEGRAEVQGTVLHQDATLDLAILEVSGLRGTPLAFREALEVAESVYVYGYGTIVTGTGLSNEDLVWSEGTVSQIQSGTPRQVVTSARVNPGNSGGPLVDAAGNWIGVVVSKSRTVGDVEGGLTYAIHSQDAVTWIEAQLASRGVKVRRGRPVRQPLEPRDIVQRLRASVVRLAGHSGPDRARSTRR